MGIGAAGRDLKRLGSIRLSPHLASAVSELFQRADLRVGAAVRVRLDSGISMHATCTTRKGGDLIRVFYSLVRDYAA